jgi:glycosyltransferase involved in cell wall biosynthesis
MLVDLANATARDGQNVSVCVTRTKGALVAELDESIDVLELDRRSRFSVRASVTLSRYVRARGVDLLHVHMRSSLSYIALLKVALLIRVPIVFHDHFGSIESDRSIPPWFRVAARVIAQYVGVCEQLRRWAVASGVPQSRARVISNGLDLSRFSGSEHVDLRGLIPQVGRRRIGVLVASFKREKGIHLLIEAMAQSRHREEIAIVVVGGGEHSPYADECRALVLKHGLADSVFFLGARTDVPAILRDADFAALASTSESGPLVLIEYLAAALPFVASRVGDIGHRVAEGGIPGFVSPGDIGELRAELDALVTLSEKDINARGEAGRALLDGNWDIRAALSRWYDVYRAALS